MTLAETQALSELDRTALIIAIGEAKGGRYSVATHSWSVHPPGELVRAILVEPNEAAAPYKKRKTSRRVTKN